MGVPGGVPFHSVTERVRTVFLTQGGLLRRTGEGEQPFGCESAVFPSHPGDEVASLPDWSTEVPRVLVWWDLEKGGSGAGMPRVHEREHSAERILTNPSRALKKYLKVCMTTRHNANWLNYV